MAVPVSNYSILEISHNFFHSQEYKYYICNSSIIAAMTETCQSLIAASQAYPECEPFGNCTGLQCRLEDISGYASFVVHKCEDPVRVDLNIVGDTFDFHQQFNRSETVDNDMSLTVTVEMSRNYTHLDFMVNASHLIMHSIYFGMHFNLCP